MISKYNLFGVVFLLTSCSYSQPDSSSSVEGWYAVDGETKTLTKEILWEDSTKENKSKEISYFDNRKSVTYYLSNDLKSGVDVIRNNQLEFQTRYEYDSFGNLLKMVVISDLDTSIVKYENVISDSLIQYAIMYSSDLGGKKVGKAQYEYTDTNMTVTVLSGDSIHSQEFYTYVEKGSKEISKYEKCQNGTCKLIEYVYSPKGRKLLGKILIDDVTTEKWKYFYNKNKDLIKVSKWTPDKEEQYVIEYGS